MHELVCNTNYFSPNTKLTGKPNELCQLIEIMIVFGILSPPPKIGNFFSVKHGETV